MPKINLIYFKHLLDYSVICFFDQYNDKFKKIDNKYVLSKNISNTIIVNFLKNSIIDLLKQHVLTYNRLKPEYYLIIGSCLPKNNILLSFKNDSYFPKKISNFLENNDQIKYLLKEKDIDINILKFNNICNKLFNDFFSKNILTKKLGNEYRNIIFIQHSQLDCYTLFKTIKFIYGKSNCFNMKEIISKNTELPPLVAINEIIKRYINCSNLNKSQKMKIISEEIKQYIDEKIKTL